MDRSLGGASGKVEAVRTPETYHGVVERAEGRTKP